MFKQGLERASFGPFLKRGLGVVVALEIAAVGLRYALQIVLARLAGAEQYGVYTVVLTWAQSLAIPAGLGLSAVVIRYVPQYVAQDEHAALQGLLIWSRRLTLAASVVLAAMAITMAGALGVEALSSYVIALSAVPLLVLSTLLSETLRGGGQLFAARVVPTVLQPALILLTSVTAAFLLQDFTANIGLVSLIAATAIGLIIQHFSITKSLRQRHLAPIGRVREWLSLGWQLLGIKVFQFILNLSDILIVGALLGPLAAGIYAAAAKTAVLTSLFSQAVNLAVPPSLARAHALGDLSSMQRDMRWSAKLAFGPSVFLALLLLVASDEILSIFGDDFSEASTALVILAVGRLGVAVTGPVGSVLSVTGHQRINLWVYGAAAVLQVALNLLLIPQFGIAGAAASNTAAVLFWNGTLYLAVGRVLGIRLWPLPGGAIRV